MSDLTRRLRGKTVAAVLTNGSTLQIRTDDGAEIDIAWVDDNGRPLKGRPVCTNHGVRLIVKGLQELLALKPTR